MGNASTPYYAEKVGSGMVVGGSRRRTETPRPCAGRGWCYGSPARRACRGTLRRAWSLHRGWRRDRNAWPGPGT